MTDEGPKLNGPDRYRKRSPRLVLEEHSHCEVPAGCGGVVLRWINADREITVQIRLYATVEGATLTIDGAAPPSSRALLARGDHVLAIHARGGAVMCSVRFEEKGYDRRVSRATRSRPTIRVVPCSRVGTVQSPPPSFGAVQRV